MGKLGVWIGVFLLLCASTYAYSLDGWVESTFTPILEGDNVTLYVNATYGNGTAVPDLSCNATADAWNTSIPMGYNASSQVYQVLIEDIPEVSNIDYNCDGQTGNVSVEVWPRWGMSWALDYNAMVSLPNRVTIESYEYDHNHLRQDPITCQYTVGNTTGIFTGNTTLVPVQFNESGVSPFSQTCNYTISGQRNWTSNITVQPYEPQLTKVTPPFGTVTASGFKLGVYDFDLDGVDDLVVLGDDLRIYAGPNYTVAEYVNPSFDSGYDFVIADVDADSDGDVVLGKVNLDQPENITLLRRGTGWLFTPEVIHGDRLIRAFGLVNFNNDFDQDVLVVSGDGALNLTYLIGPDLTSNHTGTVPADCQYVHILDFNRDFKDDLICLRDFAAFGYTRLNLLLHESYGQTAFTAISHNFTEEVDSKLLIADVDADGTYKLVTAGTNVTVHEVDLANGSVTPSDSFWTLHTLWAMAAVDVMNAHQPQLHALYFDGITPPVDNAFAVAYSGLTQLYEVNDTSFFAHNAIAAIDIDQDNDTDVLTGYQTGDQDVTLWNNSMQLYRPLNFSHGYSVTTVPAPAGQVNESVSEQAAFTVTEEASWPTAGYLLYVQFANHAFRNDVFDSRLNRRYYRTIGNGSYLFNTSNVDEYTVTVRPVSHAGLLAPAVSATNSNSNSNCVHVPGQAWNITTYCAGYAGPDWNVFEMNASPLIASNTRIDWYRVNVTGSLIEFNRTNDTMRACHFAGYGPGSRVHLVGNSSRSQTDVTYRDIQLVVNDTAVQLTNVTFINSTVHGDNAELHLRNTALPNPISRRAGSFLQVYRRVNVSFVNDHGSPVERSGVTDTILGQTVFGPATYLERDWLIQSNDTLLNHTFIFDKDYRYWPVSAELAWNISTDSFPITFNRTGMPEWDYGRNGSHQTDFRNYTLLAGIQNITGVELSIADRINLTLLSNENLSDANLTAGVTEMVDGLQLNLSGTYVLSMQVGLLEDPLMFKDSNLTDLLTYAGGIITGNITAGQYRVLENVTLVVDVPDPLPGESFDIQVTYGDYFQTISRAEGCSLTIDGVPNALINITLETGIYDYVVHCDALDLPVANVTGQIEVTARHTIASFPMDKEVLYDIVFVDGKPTVILTQSSPEGFYAYDENGGSTTYTRPQPPPVNITAPFFYRGSLFSDKEQVVVQR